MNQDQISRIAEDFWRLVRRPEPFPRVLESSVAWALPLAIVKLPRLSIFELINWLEQREISISFQAADRRLRACLVARNGRGFVFLDGADVQDEQRFSLAHEIAHLSERHTAKNLTRIYGAQLLASVILGESAGTLQTMATQLAAGGVLASFSRRDEEEADRVGYWLAKRSGFREEGLIVRLQGISAVVGIGDRIGDQFTCLYIGNIRSFGDFQRRRRLGRDLLGLRLRRELGEGAFGSGRA